MTATADGFEQSLILAHAPATAPRIRLPFDTSGLDMASDDAGGFVFTNPADKSVYTMPAPVMYGATINPDTELPTQSKVVAATLTDTVAGARLDLAPSMAWLSDPATVYPMRIDPSIAALGRVGDMFVADNITTSQISATMLHAGMFGNHAARAYPNFDVTPLAGKHVTK